MNETKTTVPEAAPPPPVTIERHRRAVYQPMAMLAAMQLDLFTPLKDGPMSAESLADALGVDAVRLRPLLYLLVTAELLTVGADGFANTAEADHYLVRGRPGYLGEMHELLSMLYSATLLTSESIRTGIPQAKVDFATLSETERHAFFRGAHPGALAAGQQLAVTERFSRFRHLLDAAGGSGGLAIAACQECSRLQATVAELPTIKPTTETFVAEARMAERVQVIAADLVEAPPEGRFDVVVLRHFIQTLSTEQASRAIHNMALALEAGGAIYILGYVLDDDRLAPPEAAAFNLAFVNLYEGGQAYTEEEYRGWLSAAGFVQIKRALLGTGHSLVSARKGG